jgi:hypothetical protein
MARRTRHSSVQAPEFSSSSRRFKSALGTNTRWAFCREQRRKNPAKAWCLTKLWCLDARVGCSLRVLRRWSISLRPRRRSSQAMQVGCGACECAARSQVVRQFGPHSPAYEHQAHDDRGALAPPTHRPRTTKPCVPLSMASRDSQCCCFRRSPRRQASHG